MMVHPGNNGQVKYGAMFYQGKLGEDKTSTGYSVYGRTRGMQNGLARYKSKSVSNVGRNV
jgi:hypothetical protein